MKRKDERVEVRLKDGRPTQFIRTTAPARGGRTLRRGGRPPGPRFPGIEPGGRARTASSARQPGPSAGRMSQAPERTTCTIMDVLEEWHVSGRWWARETTRHYLLVRTDHGTFELCHERLAGGASHWMLTGISD